MNVIITFLRRILAVLTQFPFAFFFIAAEKGTRSAIKQDAAALNSQLNISGLSGWVILCDILYSNQYFKSLYCHRIRRMRLSRLLPHAHFRLEIPYDVTIGPGLKMDHPFSTILNAKEIGCNCRIKNNITIGNKNDDESLRPIIGDNVYIGAGAIIIGNISIGSDSKIGAGAVVTKDVPPGSVVVGNPIRFL